MDYKEKDFENNNNNQNNIDKFINVLEKEKKLKSNLFIQYDVNNSVLLEDPKFRSLLLAKHWFTINKKDLYSKIIYNPFLKEKDYRRIQNIKAHHEKNIDTVFFLTFIGYFFLIKNFFNKKKLKGFFRKSLYFLSIPTILIFHFSFIRPTFINWKINEFALNSKELEDYTKLDLDVNMINKELIKYKIKI